jgi:hypothetical protein
MKSRPEIEPKRAQNISRPRERRDVFTKVICIHQLYITGDDGRESVMRWKMFLGEKKGMSQGLGSVYREFLL